MKKEIERPRYYVLVGDEETWKIALENQMWGFAQTCKHCGKEFILEQSKFCSLKCANDYIGDLENRIIRAVSDDTSHTKKLSDSE